MHIGRTKSQLETTQRKRWLHDAGRIGAALSLALSLGAANAASARPETASKKVVRVLGTAPWADTGVSVTPGDRITITGAGEVCFNDHDDSCFPPQGYPREAFVKDYFELDYAYCEDEFEAFDHAALIVQIGETVLQVGRRVTVSGVSGTVRLGVNDCSLKGKYGNSGWYSAVITVERGSD